MLADSAVVRFLLAFVASLAVGPAVPVPSAVRAALTSSPLAYAHYGRAWWGRPASVRVVRVTVRGDDAGVVLAAAGDSPTFARQDVLLRRGAQGWRVRDAAFAGELPCGDRRVLLHALFGRCGFAGQAYSGLIEGPRRRRRPTERERAAIVADQLRTDPQLRAPCIRIGVVVSNLDPRWAEVSFTFDLHLDPQCPAFNGDSLLHLVQGRWRTAAESSEGFYCTTAPAGVIRSLDGSCWLATPGFAQYARPGGRS